jgi:hypothetical protein
MRRPLLCLTFILALSYASWSGAQDQPASGAPSYSVQLRYKIDAGRAQRYRLFQAFTQRLAAAGFLKDQGLEGEEHYGTEMTGTMPASALPALLRDSFVRTAVLVPKGFQPADPQQSVLVRLYLSTALGIERQKDAAEQARALLKPLGFKESVAADTQGGLQLLGWLPFAQLKTLLTERVEVPVRPATEPGMLALKTPLIRAAVVLPEPAGLPAAAAAELPAPPADKNLEKVSAELRAQMADAGDKKLRVELILKAIPRRGDPLLELRAQGLAINGRLGPLVFGEASAAGITALAALPEVSTLRLPQAARSFGAYAVTFVPLVGELRAAARPVSQARPAGGVKAVVIAADFTGFQTLVGASLPRNTRLLDVTRELAPDFTPEEGGAAEGAPGDGVRLAERFCAEHHVDELILARIDSAAPFQVETIAAVVSGRPWSSPAFAARLEELRQSQQVLEEERSQLRVVRRIALDNYGIDETAKANREKYRQRQQAFNEMEKQVNAKSQRLLDFRAQTRDLGGAELVLVALTWSDGYADLPGAHPTLRYLDPEFLRSASWWQAMPVRGRSVWQGHFREVDGALHFNADASGRRDLNFLAWQEKDGAERGASAELPAGLVLQLKLQWLEAHDPRFASAEEDVYRMPLAQLKVVLLRQRDPSGKGLPADLFDVVAQTTGLPDRLDNDARHAIYQTDLKYQVAQPGRYLVMVVGKEPVSLAPAGSASLLNQKSEIRPRLTVEAIDPAHRAAGRVVFESFGGD